MPITNDNMPINANIWEGLDERQIEAVSYCLLNEKQTYEEISQNIGIPKGTLERWRLHRLVEKVKANKLKAITDYAERVSVKAFRVYEDQLDSEDEKVRKAAADAILDRFMGKPTQRQELTGKDGNTLSIEIVRRGDNFESTD